MPGPWKSTTQFLGMSSHKAMESNAKNTNPESSSHTEQQGEKQAKAENGEGQETRPSLLDSLSIDNKKGKKLRILKDED